MPQGSTDKGAWLGCIKGCPRCSAMLEVFCLDEWMLRRCCELLGEATK